jgi:hypothetical protein
MFVNLSKGEKMDLKYKDRQRGNRKRERDGKRMRKNKIERKKETDRKIERKLV